MLNAETVAKVHLAEYDVVEDADAEDFEASTNRVGAVAVFPRGSKIS